MAPPSLLNTRNNGAAVLGPFRVQETAPQVAIEETYGGTKSKVKKTVKNTKHSRVMHPHRFDETSKQYLLDPRVLEFVRLFFGFRACAAVDSIDEFCPGQLVRSSAGSPMIATARLHNDDRSGVMGYYTKGFDACRTPGNSGCFMSLLEPTGKGADA